MNMQFLPGSDNSTPETDEDEDGRRRGLQDITIFRKTPIGGESELGYKLGHHRINGDDVLRAQICRAIVSILDEEEISSRVISEMLFKL